MSDNKKWLDKDYANFMADYNRNTLGLNIIAVDTQSRDSYPTWSEYQYAPIPESQHENWKRRGAFCKGMARMHGRVWHRPDLVMDTYWFSIDCDNQAAIDLLCRVFSIAMNKEYSTIDDLSQDFLVDFHADTQNKVHVSGYTKKPVLAKSSDASKFKSKIDSNQIPAIEIKSQGEDGIIFCPPSYHKNGYAYEALNKIEPKILSIEQTSKLIQILDTELAKFSISYLKNATFRSASTKKSMLTIEEMSKAEFKVLAGHNRHECVLRIFESVLFTKMGIWSEEQIKEYGIGWNQEHCIPPLTDMQIEGQWHDARAFYEKHKSDKSSSSTSFGANGFEEGYREARLKELANIRLTEKDYDFVFDVLYKEARYDLKALKQIFYGMSSAFSSTPFIMGVNAPSGAGKNYLLDRVSALFPKQHIIKLAGLSDKALFHLPGIQVIKNNETGAYEPIEPMINSLNDQISDLEQQIEDLEEYSNIQDEPSKKANNKQLIKEKKDVISGIKGSIKEINNQAQKLIDFSHKILIIQDTPRMSLLETLAPILSQNTSEQEYGFTDRSGTNAPLGAKMNVLSGCPAFFSAQAIDYSGYARFDEINRRQMLVNPDMSKQKIEEAIRLQTLKWSALQEYEALVVSRKDKERAKHIVDIITAKLQLHSKNLTLGDPGVFVPYYKAIFEGLPKSDLWNMTIADRFFRYLTMSARVHADCRPKLVFPDGKRVEIIATFDDLHEALFLIQGSASGVAPHVIDWFTTVFLPAYRAKNNVPNTGVNSQGKQVTEAQAGITSVELRDKTLEIQGKSINNQKILKRYIYPLENLGFIDSSESVINKNSRIYFDIQSTEAFPFISFGKGNTLFDNLLLNIKNSDVYPNKTVLEMQIWTYQKHFFQNTDFADEKIFLPKIFDSDDKTQLSVETLVERFYSFPEKYFVAGWSQESIESEESKSAHEQRTGNTTVTAPSGAIHTKNEANGIGSNEVASKPNTNPIYHEMLESSAAFDLEWGKLHNSNGNNSNEIYCACFCDCKNHEIMLHENRYKWHSEPRKAFLKDILDSMLQYSVILGHAILAEERIDKEGKITGFNSDLKMLEHNCAEVGLVKEFEAVKSQLHFIDTFNIFANNAIKGSLSAIDIDYRTNSLEDISQAYIGEGKLQHLNGAEVGSLLESKQLEYCITDCRLVMKIVRKNDWELLKILLKLSEEIGMSFFETCNACFPTKWWAHKLKSVVYAVPEKIRITKIPFEGALVLEPVVGIHRDVVPLDISSMYPTMADIYNLSSETINCSCCVDSEITRISDQVMNAINDGLSTLNPPQIPREWHYWICQQRRGKFAEIQHELIEKKDRYKSLELKIAEKAIKIFANSGYGSFGHFGFPYYDPRLAELITSYGRTTLKGLVSLVSNPTTYNLRVLYGDTDSLFIGNGRSLENVQKVESFILEAQQSFRIKLSKEKPLKILVLTRNKKQYFGINSDGIPISKTMVGMKSDKTLFCQSVIARLISPEFIEPFIEEANLSEARERVLLFIKAAFAKLESKILAKDWDFIKSKLAYSLKASRPLDTYSNEGIHKEIYREILEHTGLTNDNNSDSGTKAYSIPEQVYFYFKIQPIQISNRQKKYTIYPENYLLDLTKYKEELFNALDPILEALGLDVDVLQKELLTMELDIKTKESS